MDDHSDLVTQQELARLVGYSDRQIRRLLDHPACPGKEGDLYDVEEWTNFLATHGRKAPDETRKAKLEAERLEIGNNRARWKFSTERGHWTRNVDISPDVQRLDDEIIRLVRDALEVVIPRKGAGKTAEELKALGIAEVDRIMAAIHRGQSSIAAKFPVPTDPDPELEPASTEEPAGE